jgi:hypothetical protein
MNRNDFSLIVAGSDDLDVLIDHRRKMWITFGSHNMEEIEECIPVYRVSVPS